MSVSLSLCLSVCLYVCLSVGPLSQHLTLMHTTTVLRCALCSSHTLYLTVTLSALSTPNTKAHSHSSTVCTVQPSHSLSLCPLSQHLTLRHTTTVLQSVLCSPHTLCLSVTLSALSTPNTKAHNYSSTLCTVQPSHCLSLCPPSQHLNTKAHNYRFTFCTVQTLTLGPSS